MPLLRLVPLLLALQTSFVFAESGKSTKNFFYIEAGAYINNLKERMNAPAGYASQLSDFKGYFRVHPGFSIGKGWKFEPSLGTMLPSRDGVDGKTSAFESQLALQVSAPLFKVLTARFGPGIEWMWLLSKSEAVTLRNGLDESTFYVPGRSSHVFLFTATAGFSIHLHDRWMICLDLYVPEFLSTLKRRFNVSATLGFRL